MAKFAKLFDVSDGTQQVVVINKGWCPEDEKYQLVATTHVDHPKVNVNVSATFDFDTLEKLEDAFTRYGQANAEELRRDIDNKVTKALHEE